MEEDGQGADHSYALPGKEAGTNSQTVSEVVEAVSDQIEASNLDILHLFYSLLKSCHEARAHPPPHVSDHGSGCDHDDHYQAPEF